MPAETENAIQETETGVRGKKPRKRGFWRMLRRVTLVFLLCLIVLLIGVRLYLPVFTRDYVNRTLDRSKIYHGKIGQIHIHLLRGSYSIDDVRLVKVTGNVPVPLFSAKRVDLEMEWHALLKHHHLVGAVEMFSPQVNFVDAPDAAESQTGDGGPWLQIIRDLFPFKINTVWVHDGSVHFRTYAANHPVDVYLSQLEASIDDLSNIQRSITPLITTVTAKGMAMDQAKFQCQMKLNPFSYNPTFHLGVRLLGLDVTKLNELAKAYGGFDFKNGWFDLVVEADSKEGQMSGYVKPLFRNLVLFKLPDDLKDENPLQFVWQAILGTTELVLKNQPRDQFGTLIPFNADLDMQGGGGGGAQPDILATIGGVLRNGFVRAYLPKLQPPDPGAEAIHFSAPSLTEGMTAGDKQP